MSAPDKPERSVLSDANLGNNNNSKYATYHEPKTVAVTLAQPPPSIFSGQQSPQKPISSLVTNGNGLNGDKGPISSSDSNVNRKLPDVSAVIVPSSQPSSEDMTSQQFVNIDNATDKDDGDDDVIDDVTDEKQALEAVETRKEKIGRQRLPSERLKEESAAARRARQRQAMLKMISPHKPKEYKLCSVVVLLFIISLVMFIVVMSLKPIRNYDIYYLDGKSGERLAVDARTLTFSIEGNQRRTVFSGKFWRSKSDAQLPLYFTNRTAYESSISLHWKDTQRLDISHTVEGDNNMSCFKVSWDAVADDVWHMDCFDLRGSRWFGGGLLQSGAWSVDRISLLRVPFVTGSIHWVGSLGPVLERYWITSEGVAVIIDDETPLHISVNSPVRGENKTDEALCLYSDFESDLSQMYNSSHTSDGDSSSGYFNDGMSQARTRHGPLRYSICMGSTTQEVLAYLAKRSTAEDDRPVQPALYRNLMKRPVWSTKQYKKPDQLNQTSLLEFADAIATKGYGHSMLIVDGDWERAAGDLAYNMEKFNDAVQMNMELKSKGFMVSLSVSPHISTESNAFASAMNSEVLVKDIAGLVPSLTRLQSTAFDNQEQKFAAVVDITSDSAANWLMSRIERFLSDKSADSICVTGSDVASLPAVPMFQKRLPNLNEFTRDACHSFANIGRQAFVFEAAYKCQHAPVIIRLSESSSTWSQTGGLGNVIASVLALNIIGYPYIIPDPVGGEIEVQEGGRFSARELYIRWMQISTFLPVMHLSTPPHHHGNSTEQIARDLLALRESIVIPELMRVLNESIHKHEMPTFVRPLWWSAQNSSDPAFNIEDEFLVGELILVAPILEIGKTRRSIYLTEGLWEDQLNNFGGIHSGPKWLWNYKVPLSEVAYFIRKKPH